MKIDGTSYRTIWPDDNDQVAIIDQTRLPHEWVVVTLSNVNDAAHAISSMQVRGAPLIGATAAYGMALATNQGSDESWLTDAAAQLLATRPTAVNLRWALDQMSQLLPTLPANERQAAAWSLAAKICDDDVANCAAIGEHGADVIADIAATKPAGEAVNILTHCNAGWLATVDWGTALAPIYKAFDRGINVRVYVDETRPRNQGAHLTAWELGQHGVDHTLIVDNAGGHLMQHGKIDVVIVGSDRTTGHGDVCNKIGTYLKALAADANDIPFYVALPISTIDFTMGDGLLSVPIEERSGDEVTWISGRTRSGEVTEVCIAPPNCVAANPAFDVTPRHLVTSLITEAGLVSANPDAIANIRPR